MDKKRKGALPKQFLPHVMKDRRKKPTAPAYDGKEKKNV